MFTDFEAIAPEQLRRLRGEEQGDDRPGQALVGRVLDRRCLVDHPTGAGLGGERRDTDGQHGDEAQAHGLVP